MTKTFAQDYITSSNGKYTVHGHNGRSFGTYGSEGEAKKRLEQIEWFKTHSKDMAPEKFNEMKKLFGEFIDEEKDEPEHQSKDSADDIRDEIRKIEDRIDSLKRGRFPTGAQHLKTEEGRKQEITKLEGEVRTLKKKLVGDSGPQIGGGVVLQAPSGRVLLLKRGGIEGKDNYVGHWGLPGGKAEDGEGPEDAAGREAFEETGYAFGAMHKDLGTVRTPNGFDFTTYLHRTKDEFAPKLDSEHTEHKWAALDDLPEPMHPGVAETLGKLRVAGGAHDHLAMDKDSVRTIDDAGRMHVEAVHISKACVNPYRGEEIPGWEELGLEPDRIYQMFRDPAELDRAADSFNGIQLLIIHTPVSVEDHRPNEIVGCTGTTAKFTDPYLDNELVIWAQSGVDAVESGLQKELSCGYAYDPVMEPGAYEGVKYDGKMTNIRGNHVALVEKGRAGPEVVVGDCALEDRGWEVIEQALLSLVEQ